MRKLPLLLPVFVLAAHANATVYLTEAQAMEAIFPGQKMEAAPVELTRAQMDAIAKKTDVRVRNKTVKAWKTKTGDWLIVDDVLGKHEYITFALGIKADGSVAGVEIMEYKETYGGEVRGKEWRSQFHDKTAKDPIRLDRDIRNISGATLSSRHVTDGVRRLVATHDLVLKNK